MLLVDYGDNKDTIDTLLGKMEDGLKEAGGEVEGEDVEAIKAKTEALAEAAALAHAEQIDGRIEILGVDLGGSRII